jgi:putative SOS response-associated peptidase YedK
MCYSSRIEADYRRYLRETDARLSFDDFRLIFWERSKGRKVKIPRAMEDAFLAGDSPEEMAIAALIREHRAAETVRLEQELFAQRTRLADAERKLAEKTTKAASESKRIAASKVTQIMGWLADLRRTDGQGGDARIFPGVYAYVLVVENGQRVVKPMRYGCRPAGKPANYDIKYPGTYNARRDNLEGFWKGQFGRGHGVALWWRFYEHVDRAGQDVVLEFTPSTGDLMAVACLYSHWTPPAGSDEPDLWSFAAITDEPPPEVAAAGHDRCIIPLKPENLESWLNPDPADLAAQQAILDHRQRYFYEHRMAA